jgi:hypothetical protein
MYRCIPNLYAEYGRGIDKERAIPEIEDALKPVERRILLSLHDVTKGRSKKVKSARVVGDCIGRMHPHGDQSAYGTLVQTVRRGFAIGQGNWGYESYEESAPAAMRYTEVGTNEFLIKLAFEFHKQVPTHDPEELGYQQARYLASPIPIGLIGNRLTYGIAFNTCLIPQYNLMDLLNRLAYIVGIWPQDQPEPIPIPVIYDYNVYEEKPGDAKKLFTLGKGHLIGVPDITVDSDGVHIHGVIDSWAKLSKLQETEEEMPFKIIDASAKDVKEVICVPKGQITQPFIDMIFKVMTKKFHFKCNFVSSEKTIDITPLDKVIQKSYDLWSYHYKQQLEAQLRGYQEKAYELSVVLVVRNILTDNPKALNRVQDIIDIYEADPRYQQAAIGSEAIKHVCSKYKISNLIETRIDIQSVQNKIKPIEDMLSNMAQTCISKIGTLFGG